MKFSYSLVKKLVPGVKSKKELVEKLNLHSFETENAAGDVFEVSIPPNRFSDAASHWGIAREIAAILNLKLKTSNPKEIQNFKSKTQKFAVEIQDKSLCPRYAAQYFENIKMAPSLKWIQKILVDCGLRPINNVVDIMNYAMLETGQPLHAFDFDKIERRNPKIIVRRAKKGEKITTLDNSAFELNENILVIADEKNPLAIAGLKGGKAVEVDKNTKRIIVEAANFNSANIYKTSKILKLSTDASLRFSHSLSPELVSIGLSRAGQLLQKIVKAKPGPLVDINNTKPFKKIIKFDLEKFNKFIGTNLDSKTVRRYLERLGFKITHNSKLKNQNSFFAAVPSLRQDIENFEDLAEEIARLYGYNRLKSAPPHIHLTPSGYEDQIILKDKIRKVLTGLGLDEVYNYSFISESETKKFFGNNSLELENPISQDFSHLRPTLAVNLCKNIENNFRFFDEIKIFEIGRIFKQASADYLQTGADKIPRESTFLGIALASKNKKGEIFFQLKGVIERLFRKIGLREYLMIESSVSRNYLLTGEVLDVKSEGKIIGYLGRLNQELIENKEGVLAEIDLEKLLKLIIEEHEYQALPKYPSVMRDLSVLVSRTARVGEIIQLIQETDLKTIEDVDLIDEYEHPQALTKSQTQITRSLTFRIVFQAEDRTLTDKEVDKKINKIIELLKSKFRAQIR